MKKMVLLVLLLIVVSGCVTIETKKSDKDIDEQTLNESVDTTEIISNEANNGSQGAANFNVEVDLPKSYRKISPGEELWFTTKLLNLANQKRIDVTLLYNVLNVSK